MIVRMRPVLSLCVALMAGTSPLVAGGLDGLFGFVTPTKTAAISQANAQAGITQYSPSHLQAMKASIAAYKAGDVAKGDQLSTPLGASRRTVYKLAALFSLDSFAGGFAVQSLLALWLFRIA